MHQHIERSLEDVLIGVLEVNSAQKDIGKNYVKRRTCD